MRWLIAIGELALMVWFVAIGIEAIVQRAMFFRSPFRLREWHHAYVGVVVVASGWWLDSVTGIFLQILGIILSLDDLYQHHRQTIDGLSNFQSPLHVLFGRTLWRLAAVRWLVPRLDQWWPLGAVLTLLAIWLFA